MKLTAINSKGIKIQFVSYDQPLDGGLKDYISEGDIVLNQESNRGGDAFAISTSIIMNNGKLYSMRNKDNREKLIGLSVLSSD